MTKGEKREYGKRIKKTISGFVVNGAFCCDVLFYAWAIFLFRTYTGSVSVARDRDNEAKRPRKWRGTLLAD